MFKTQLYKNLKFDIKIIHTCNKALQKQLGWTWACNQDDFEEMIKLAKLLFKCVWGKGKSINCFNTLRNTNYLMT